MRFIRRKEVLPILLLVLIGGYTLWYTNANTVAQVTIDALNGVTAQGAWFPNLKQRLFYGAPDTWRSPDSPETTTEVIDPIANRVFYMLKTGADVLYDRLPIHLETTFKRFPHHQVYADSSATVGGETVVDVIDMLPEALVVEYLPGYKLRVQQYEESWGWDSRQIVQKESEGWDSDKFKNIPMMLHAYKTAPKSTDWFVIADDDTFVHSASLGSILKGLNPQEHHYIGSAAMIRGGFAEEGDVGRELKSLKPDDPVTLWFGHGGSGYIVSRGAVEALFWDPQREEDLIGKYTNYATAVCCGDAAFGFMLREELRLFVNDKIESYELDVDPFQGESIETTQIDISGGGLCRRVLTWHHLAAWEVQKLFDWESSLVSRKSSSAMGVLYSDFYHDFILPYISSYREHWDNGASSVKYTWEHAIGVQGEKQGPIEDDPDHIWVEPFKNPESCIKACEIFPQCIGWKYDIVQPNNTCSLEYRNVRKGISKSPLRNNAENIDESVISGWMIDRLRVFRSGELCDSLNYDLDTGLYTDSEEESEGWYFRKLSEEQKGHSDRPVYEN